jgi:hypothetical protein
VKPIVKPGTPAWVRGMASGPQSRPTPWTAINVVAFLAACVGATALMATRTPVGGAVGVVLALAIAVAFATGMLRYNRNVVEAPRWRYGRTELAGEGLALLKDIQTRFEYAETFMAELPESFGPVDVDEDVAALLWEAAGHAARVTELDHRLIGLQYARPGSPGAVLREELHATRTAHLDELRGIQRQAEDLATLAGDASAAAEVAKERTGSAYELEIVTSGSAQSEAATALEAAKERLRFASSVWSELDETTKITRAALEQERRRLEG